MARVEADVTNCVPGESRWNDLWYCLDA